MNYIITESQLKVLIKEQNLTLPYTKKGSHTAPNGDCDALHGFQLSRIGSDMNGIVKTELDKFSNQGVWVSDVKVTVNGMKVDWEVTIDKSSDGQFWNGFTSRGAGCNSGIDKRWNSEEVGNGPESIKTNIINDKDKQGNKKTPICKNVSNIELVKKVEFTNLGKNSFIQGFYRYKCGDEVKNTQPTQQKTSNNLFKDYEGSYTFVSEKGEKTIGSIKEENGKLLVSRGSNSFYLTKTETDQFEGKTKASNKEDERIPKMLGYITIDVTAKFNRNSDNQVCGVDGIAKWGGKKEKMLATKDGVSCVGAPIEKSITTTSTIPQKSTTPVSTTTEKPITPATVPSQRPVTTPQTPNTGTRKKPITPLNVVSPEKYSVRIGEQTDNTYLKKPPKKWDAILVGGIDNKKGFVSIDGQLSLFKKGFGMSSNVKDFRYSESVKNVLDFLKDNPKIPVFLFSAGCNMADELINSQYVDKQKLYVIEPYNGENGLNGSVSRAISNGLSINNVFVGKSKGRGYGFKGAQDSGSSSHFGSLTSIGGKFPNNINL